MEWVIADGIDAVLVTPNDRQDVGRGLVSLVVDREMREKMGGAERVKVLASFTWERVAAGVERAYRAARASTGDRSRRRAVA
jgi:D-inositol-3-phosphate glycosyltransferase